MIKEYDVVKARKNLSDKIQKGCIGAVLMVFQDPTLAYEVEFVDETGETIEIMTAYPKDIEVSSK